MPLKPQDLLVCLALADRGPRPWTYADLSENLGLSASEANMAVERAMTAGLLTPSTEPRGKPGPVRAALLEFLVHGVRHAFFVKPGPIVRGMPTAHSAPPLLQHLRGGDEPPLVWPDAKGEQRGQAVEPLYPSVPDAARRNPKLYELLALTDALRCGRARERKLAASELGKRLSDGR
jgi:hypothetical protein